MTCMRSSRSFAFCALVGGGIALAGGSGCLSAPTPNSTDVSAVPRGCTIEGGTPPATSPNGYYTSGATVCTEGGTPHQFRGVDRPSLEWSSQGVNISIDDFRSMVGWGANVVRIALNQDFWLSGAALNDPAYPATVDQAVKWAEAAGLDVILDLHWSDAGDLTVTATDVQGPGHSNQQEMADVNSIEFWKEVANAYKGDGHVLFELYNEPNGISWDVWLNGGPAGHYMAAGMQQLYDAVRGTGANNIVIAGGLSWAYDLSAVGPTGSYVHGYNVMYATHPYASSDAPSGWEGSFGHLATTDFAPVIVTEFGDGRAQCTGAYDQTLIAFANNHVSWTAWAWFPDVTPADPEGCRFPSLIVDWAGTPSVQGAVVKAALRSSAGLAASPSAVDAEGGASEGSDEGASSDTDAGTGGDATLDPEGEPPPIESKEDAPGQASDDATDAANSE
jgi:endoglucanase